MRYLFLYSRSCLLPLLPGFLVFLVRSNRTSILQGCKKSLLLGGSLPILPTCKLSELHPGVLCPSNTDMPRRCKLK